MRRGCPECCYVCLIDDRRPSKPAQKGIAASLPARDAALAGVQGRFVEAQYVWTSFLLEHLIECRRRIGDLDSMLVLIVIGLAALRQIQKARELEGGHIAIGYKNHVAIDRRHGLIRGWTASHVAAHDGARLAEVVDADNTAGDVWAGDRRSAEGHTAYRSAKNEAWLAERGLVSRIRRKKPPGRPMAARTRRANARKSAVRSAVEHVFARQKGPMGLVVRTIGIARARVKIGLANLAQNMRRFVWLSGKAAPA